MMLYVWAFLLSVLSGIMFGHGAMGVFVASFAKANGENTNAVAVFILTAVVLLIGLAAFVVVLIKYIKCCQQDRDWKKITLSILLFVALLWPSAMVGAHFVFPALLWALNLFL